MGLADPRLITSEVEGVGDIFKVQNTMHRLAQNKGAYLGGTGVAGSGYPKMNKGYPS